MIRAGLIAGLVASLSACAPAPASLSDEPARIGAIDYFILRASQAGMAGVLARNCPRYRLNTVKEQELKRRTIARIGGEQAAPKTREGRRALTKKSQTETARYVKAYQTENNLTFAAKPADYCRVADKEVAAQSIIGQLLIKG